MTHTAGPYTVALVGDTFWVQAPVGHGMARLAIIDDGAGTKPRENAHLFAAAPDMKLALEHVRDGHTDMDEINAAIAKADGRTE